MSFPFLQPYAGLGNSLQTAQAAAGGPVGGWVELGRTTLGAANSSMSVSSLPDKRYYMVLTFVTSETSNSDVSARLNSDTGSNYARRGTYNGNSDFTGINSTAMNWIVTDSIKPTAPMLGVHYISNLASKEKLVMGEGSRSNAVTSGGGGVANIPSRSSVAQKWVNTSNAIDEIETYVSSQFNSGSELVVLGWDPADTHTTNFWEELDDSSWSSGDNWTSGTFSAKKYLCVQFYTEGAAGSNYFRFNGDSGTNYNNRYSINGGSDSTIASQPESYLGAIDGLSFHNVFIINNASNEKILIHNRVSRSTVGAGTAVTRSKGTGRWVNTSDQITSITVTTAGGGNFTAGNMKVWGSD
jgi:hypothetical protein